MNEHDLTVSVSGVVTRGTSRPTTLLWKVTATDADTPETIGRAVTEACRLLNTALKEAVK